MPVDLPAPPTAVQRQWHAFTNARCAPIADGLINLTFRLDCGDGQRVILQRLNPIFSPRVNEDIHAVTQHLRQHGVATPQLIPTDSGELWVTAEDGIWRAMTFIHGIAPNALETPAMAWQAGALVARFHRALSDFRYQYQSGRSHVHDTQRHLDQLTQALGAHRRHRLYDAVAPLAAAVLEQSLGMVDLTSLPLRHAHGDLKISNVMFDAAGQGLCLIDLDTLAQMPWPLEMGDALRSWCNPRQEDRSPAEFDLRLFQAAITGYRSVAADLPTTSEWELLVAGVARICLELTARFLTDALHETYFAWDCRRYAARGEHNLARARAMHGLHQDLSRQRAAAERLARGAAWVGAG
jgi:Ser/Thr protein kinase RdoA (MazF antagonist)